MSANKMHIIVRDLVCDTIEQIAPNKPKSVLIFESTNGILNLDIWSGNEVLKDINLARTLKTNLGFSDKWIFEYMTKLLSNN